MPPPPTPTNVYPCLDWIVQGVARAKPLRIRLTDKDLRMLVTDAKLRYMRGQIEKGETDRLGAETSSAPSRVDDVQSVVTRQEVQGEPKDDDDVIMKEYGFDNYDDEDNNGEVTACPTNDPHHELSEDEAGDGVAATHVFDLAGELGALTYHSSNSEDPYLTQSNVGDDEDEKQEEEELEIKPTDSLIIAGHVSKDESSIEVFVYDNESNEFYLHHDIIQPDYPCCVRWIGHARGSAKNLAAVGYMSPEIMLWDLDVVDSLEPIETLAGHKDAVIDICWNSHMKNYLASGSADGHVKIWNLDTCKHIFDTELTGKVSALEFGLHDQFLLLAGDLNQNVSLIDTRAKQVTNSWQLLGEVERVRWIPTDNSKFLVSDELGYIYCFDVRNSKQETSKFRAHQNSVTGLEFCPPYKHMLVTASADNTIKVWNTSSAFRDNDTVGNNPTLVKELANLRVGRILSLRVCPNKPGLIAVGGDSKCNSFRTYDLTREQEVRDVFMNQ